ncbi:sigma factor [Aureimonas sp. AU40]|uniref:sigma factor n=1 Tax=Aureimonas sp. AU40 TaxID=1637747 RepID=UPI000785C0BD|nr:sigma factor [Aureimonas sp. AU40]
MQRYEDSKKDITSFAWKVLRRAHAAGARTITLEDIVSELGIAWCEAAKRFDPTAGASFRTFLWNGMRMHINRWFETEVTRRHGEAVAASIDASQSDADDGPTLADILASDDLDPEQIAARETFYAAVLRQLSERARLFVVILREEPEEVMAEVDRLRERADFAKSRGITQPFYNRLTAALVFDLMDASAPERNAIQAEIRAACARL